MSEFIACVSDPRRPGQVEIIASRTDPRLERGEGFDMLRKRGWPTLEWTLPVVDRANTLSALTRAMGRAHQGHGIFACHPMDARGEAVKLTMIRSAPPKPGLLARMGLRRKAA